MHRIFPLAVLAVVAAAVWRVRESHRRVVSRLREVRVHPRIGVPRDRLREFTAPAVTGFVSSRWVGSTSRASRASCCATCTTPTWRSAG